MMKRFILLAALSLCFLFSNAQVLNIESMRFQNDSNGWEGTIKFDLSAQHNINKVYSFGNSVHIQYRHDRSRFIFLNSFEVSNANGETFVNTGYQHLRYNYQLKKYARWTLEAFLQSQYNKPMKMDFRGLIGVGPRYRAVKTEKIHLYIAALYMFEHEEDQGDPLELIYNDHRLDSYVTLTWLPAKNCELVNTVYYQPAFTDFSDYRISETFSLAILAGKHFGLETAFALTYDTKQPEGIPELFWSLGQKLIYNF